MEERLKLEMTFKRDDGGNSKLSVDEVRADITTEEATSLMDGLIEKDVFLINGHGYAEKVGAQLVRTETTTLI